MGDEVSGSALAHWDQSAYRAKLQAGREALAQLLADRRLDRDRPLTGLELELDLLEHNGDPAFANEAVLQYLHTTGDEEALYSAQHELGAFNIELNLPPRMLDGAGISWYESDLAAALAEVREAAGKAGVYCCPIGTMPTLFTEHMDVESLSSAERYRVLNDGIMAARGEDLRIDITGAESVDYSCANIAPESANTSVQFHLQVAPERFHRYWNTAQALAGVQIALGANSPYLFGRQLWAETRIVLFEQGTDTRRADQRRAGAMPRAWFGERWIDSVLDLFDENYKHFAPLLPLCDPEDPLAVAASGGVPVLRELRFHNGSIYRWNRPVYDIRSGRPHLRVENRVLPAGPTPVDICANMALFYGLMAHFAERGEQLSDELDFASATANFRAAARHGIQADQVWPGRGRVPVRKLVLEELLPLAAEGLASMGVVRRDADRFLDVIEQRCRRGVNGASWQVARVQVAEHRQRLERFDALRAMVLDYAAQAADGRPVHEWEV
ncbi:glutamate-cysteine ligase family protein [Glycomyces sp. L485]|uniref:glutamate-cysteine ligase family protein n=1 Tax=Glycomyces sp. L485 TaxID=2909235 RepID=UPI001F4B9349|nr:glutamate-cysteine ligase family protein [Glycomyces sp. L485]MCH7229459.1 glutamate-cysteine ligase family protein [Glycomyces sp. L485]